MFGKNNVWANKTVLLLWVAITVYTVAFIMITFWKYSHNLYDNLDLAIFNNVLFNTVHGEWFRATIHPSSYLGDHFSPFLLTLAPLYVLWQDPRLLLIVQTITIALCAWPLFYLAHAPKRGIYPEGAFGARRGENEPFFQQKKTAYPEGYMPRGGVLLGWLPFFVALLWLLNPSVHNMTVFEFSLVPFAVFFLLWSLYFYQHKKFFPHIVFLFLAITTREDVAFIALAYGALALIERRSLRWMLIPFTLSSMWLIASFSIIKIFASSLSYKFLIYYGWLVPLEAAPLTGFASLQILFSFLTHPLQLLAHFFTFRNVEFILGLTFPFFFLLFRPHRYYILLIPPLAQILLSAQGGSALVIQTHYAGLFLVTLFPLCAAQLYAIHENKWPRFIPTIFRSPQLWLLTIFAATLYATATYGSLLSAATRMIQKNYAPTPATFTSVIPPDAPVAASWSLLTPLSSRSNIYLLHYALIEKNQFALTDYALPSDTEFIAINAEDILKGRIHINEHPRYAQFTEIYERNVSKLLGESKAIYADGPYIVLSKPDERLPLDFRHLSLVDMADAATASGKNPEISHYQEAGRSVTISIRMPQQPVEVLHYYVTMVTDRRSFNLPLAYGIIRSDEASGDITMHVYLSSGETIQEKPALSYWESGSLYLGGIKNLEWELDENDIPPT